jgi:hypothetical protein
MDIILQGIKRYVPQKTLSKNSDHEYYNKEVKRLHVKVRNMYNKRKFGQPYQAELRRLSKELLVAKKADQETLYVRSYETKLCAGQVSVSMLNDVKEIEKVFWQSRTITSSSPQIQYKRPTTSTIVRRLYSVAKEIIHKYNQQNLVNPLPIALTL